MSRPTGPRGGDMGDPDRPTTPPDASPFDTETMADLHLRQGRRREAQAILRRLAAHARDEAARLRAQQRLAEIDGAESQSGVTTIDHVPVRDAQTTPSGDAPPAESPRIFTDPVSPRSAAGAAKDTALPFHFVEVADSAALPPHAALGLSREGDDLRVTWSLPIGAVPAGNAAEVRILVVHQAAATPDRPRTDTLTVPLPSATGGLVVETQGLRRATAALGHRGQAGFRPLVGARDSV